MLLLIAVSRWVGVLSGMVPVQAESLVSRGESAETGN
jgi:hypothetical protein